MTIAGVVLVVLLLSRPRLRDFALSENETDAYRLLERVGLACDEVHAGEKTDAGHPTGPTTIGALLDERPDLQRWVQDGELDEDGARLLHRGYYFDLVEDPDGGSALRAWPQRYGETGWAAFLRTPAGALIGHANDQATWSGPDRAPSAPGRAPLDPGWQPVAVERP